MSKGVCLFVCKICIIISRQMFVYNITMFKITEVCPCMHIIYLYQDMNIVHLLYIRVFQHLYFIIILNLVLLFLMSITVVKNYDNVP